MTLFNVTADFEAGAHASDLDDDVEALKDLHVAIFEDAHRARSYTLTLDAPNAWSATETAMARLAEVGAAPSRLLALDVLTTAAFDAREGFDA
ncbi:hypothetical protein [Puerhibacterium sp. TATVAM-FAB25]|uniref:hypothetical protein n=1 Tax=Puerhibacterium sp. TATVAM-FAB25 TaxID=3093699 RepID=UPI00397DFF1C